jgi:hypothetical protein
VGTAAAGLMTWMGGQTGIAAGSAYAVAQSASMGGAATGLVATVGGMTVGGVLVAAAAVPVAVVGLQQMPWDWVLGLVGR